MQPVEDLEKVIAHCGKTEIFPAANNFERTQILMETADAAFEIVQTRIVAYQSDVVHEVAARCLKRARSLCLSEGLVHLFNTFMKSNFKDDEEDNMDFFERHVRGEILLISTTEDSASDVSPSDADHFDRTTYMISRMEREEQQQEEATRLVAAAALAPPQDGFFDEMD